MTWSIVLTSFQIIIAIILGAIVARISRDLVRELVVRSMPVEKRLSDESFNIQTRTSTIIAFVLFFLVTGLSYWGISKLKNSILPAVSLTEQQTIVPFLPEVFTPLPEKEPIQEEEKEEKPLQKNTNPGTPKPKAYKQPQKLNKSFFVQLGAYTNADNVLNAMNRQPEKLNTMVQVLKIENTKGPYKLLIGPFVSREEAKFFQKRNQLEGFIKEIG